MKTLFEQAVEIIETHPNLADFQGEKSEELIAAAEAELGVKFPDSYRHFLRKFGNGGFYGREFYGLIDAGFTRCVPDAVGLTLDDREQFGLPHHLVRIHEVGEGTSMALDTSVWFDEYECPVVEYFLTGPPTELASSFGEFFLDEVKQALESARESGDAPAAPATDSDLFTGWEKVTDLEIDP